MQNYLFVHFKEKRTPDGEQVYFAISRDGFHWDKVNDGQPVLWSMKGEKGVRDFTVIRSHAGKFYIIATDLSLAYSMRTKYMNSWKKVQEEGSNNLIMWESEDLCHWSSDMELPIRKPGSGCCWAPDAIEDRKTGEFIIHWSSPDFSDNNGRMKIYYTRTKDFVSFTEPEILFAKEDSGVIDSCMVEENGRFYLWVKSDRNPCSVLMYSSDNITGPFNRMESFEKEMQTLVGGANCYEAPTACRLPDGGYNLFLDFFGVRGAGQGYVPFHADDISTGEFKRCDADVSTPYGFKHGTILPISDEEYERIKNFDFNAESYNR